MPRLFRPRWAAWILAAALASLGAATPDPDYGDLRWRLVGPFRGGWAPVAAGVPTDANRSPSSVPAGKLANRMTVIVRKHRRTTAIEATASTPPMRTRFTLRVKATRLFEDAVDFVIAPSTFPERARTTPGRSSRSARIRHH